MFCSNCGSRLLDGTNQCLHCGRVEASLKINRPAAPVFQEEPKKRRAPWVVGVLSTLAVAGLSTALVLLGPGAAMPGVSGVPGIPTELPSARPATVKMVPDADGPLSPGWELRKSTLGGEGAEVTWLQPGALDERFVDLGVVVSAAKDATYVRGVDLSKGAIVWQHRLNGRAACAYDRTEAVICFSSTREATRLALSGGELVGPTRRTTVEEPAKVWVAPDGAYYVASATSGAEKAVDKGGKSVKTWPLTVRLARVDAGGAVVWSTQGSLWSSTRQIELDGSDTLVALTTTLAGSGTPALIRTQLGGSAVVADGTSTTLLPDGRLAAQGEGTQVLLDSSGKELFPIPGAALGDLTRDLPVDKVPAMSLVPPQRNLPGHPQAPTLVSIAPTGATGALGKGRPVAVCGGALVTTTAPEDPISLSAQGVADGRQLWSVPYPDALVDVVCDGKRVIALTKDSQGVLSARAYFTATGDPAWRQEYKDRKLSLVTAVAHQGWLMFDQESGSYVMVG